jgi:uncharacterized protein YecT (DUF1311 family)
MASCTSKQEMSFMKRLIVPAAITFGMSILPVVAADQELSKKIDACSDKAGGVTEAMIQCVSAEYERQEERLNQYYVKLLGSLSEDRSKALLEAQRKWLKFRDANCRFHYDPDGGSAARVVASTCRLKATVDRAKELEQFVDRQ